MLTYRIDARFGAVQRHGYLWMKKVTGFDPRHHCAKCLTGAYENNFGLKAPVNEPVTLDGYAPGDVVYVCSVSRPYNWHRNRHMALRIREGAEAVMRLWTDDEIRFWNAEPIAFDGRVAMECFADKGDEFTTCRNFQFGAQHFASAPG